MQEDNFPLERFKERFGGLEPGPRGYAFILMGGSFSPLHRSHLACLGAGRKALERSGFAVVGGYLVPSTEKHVRRKLGEEGLGAEERCDMCRECVRDSEWIEVLGNYADTRFVKYGMVDVFPRVFRTEKITCFELYGSDVTSNPYDPFWCTEEAMIVVSRDPEHAAEIRHHVETNPTTTHPDFHLVDGSDYNVHPYSSSAVRSAIASRDVPTLRDMLPECVMSRVCPWAGVA